VCSTNRKDKDEYGNHSEDGSELGRSLRLICEGQNINDHYAISTPVFVDELLKLLIDK
jgi:hypothetical protein